MARNARLHIRGRAAKPAATTHNDLSGAAQTAMSPTALPTITADPAPCLAEPLPRSVAGVLGPAARSIPPCLARALACSRPSRQRRTASLICSRAGLATPACHTVE
jgi:hypothetical protein